ncbi:MAG TPA: hypothetical protein VGC95_05155 [Chitinophagaceae bacterium]
MFISLFIALPVAGLLMNEWLRSYADRTPLEWWVFGMAAAAALLIAVITVTFQIARAAITNPVKTLKSE